MRPMEANVRWAGPWEVRQDGAPLESYQHEENAIHAVAVLAAHEARCNRTTKVEYVNNPNWNNWNAVARTSAG